MVNGVQYTDLEICSTYEFEYNLYNNGTILIAIVLIVFNLIIRSILISLI